MLTVHHLGISQSERIVWLCEELEIDYELKRYDRRADNRLAPDDYKALHPMGIAPVITDGDLVLGESGAICDYICGRYGDGRLTPGPDDPDFAGHLFWFHGSNATFMTTLMMQLVLSGGGEGNPAAPFVADRSRRGWEMVEAACRSAVLWRRESHHRGHHDGLLPDHQPGLSRHVHRGLSQREGLSEAHRRSGPLSKGHGQGGAWHGADVGLRYPHGR
jgi:glutathione S-transferase